MTSRMVRRAGLTRLGWSLAIALAVLVGFVAGSIVVAARGQELSPTPSPAPTWTAVTEATETPRYAPSSRGGRPTVVRWAPLVERYDWPVDVALRVLDCESGGDPSVPNAAGSGALGLFQAMPNWRGLAWELTGSSDLGDPTVNVAVAYYLWRDSGGTFGYWGADGRAHGHWAASIGCWSW